MKKISILILSIFLASCQDTSAGSPSSKQAFAKSEGLFTEVIKVDGLSRNYKYYIPPGLDNAAALVILLHANGVSPGIITGDDDIETPYSRWFELSREHNFIVLVPEGAVGSNNRIGWNDCRSDALSNPDTDDVQFVSALIDKFSREFKINEKRVYATGTSNGGHMSLRLAIELPGKIAAAAPIVASMAKDSQCADPIAAVPVLFMNGTLDPISSYYEGGLIGDPDDERGTGLSVSESVEIWTKLNGMNSIPSEDIFDDIDQTDDSVARKFSYGSSRDPFQVVLYEMEGAGHSEPSIQVQYGWLFEQIFGKQNNDIEMADQIWGFLSNKIRR